MRKGKRVLFLFFMRSHVLVEFFDGHDVDPSLAVFLLLFVGMGRGGRKGRLSVLKPLAKLAIYAT